jgi:hypothetical protein
MNGHHGPEPPRSGPVPPRVEARPSGDLCTWVGFRGPDLPSLRGGGPVSPRAPEKSAAKPALPRVWWQPAFYETPVMPVGGVRVPGSGRGLSMTRRVGMLTPR